MEDERVASHPHCTGVDEDACASMSVAQVNVCIQFVAGICDLSTKQNKKKRKLNRFVCDVVFFSKASRVRSWKYTCDNV